MNNFLHLVIAFFLSFSLSNSAIAQNDSLVKVIATVSPINDSTYQLQYTIQTKEGWRVFGQTISPEAITDTFTTPPHFLFSLETIKLKGPTTFSTGATQQKDELFERHSYFQ